MGEKIGCAGDSVRGGSRGRDSSDSHFSLLQRSVSRLSSGSEFDRECIWVANQLDAYSSVGIFLKELPDLME